MKRCLALLLCVLLLTSSVPLVSADIYNDDWFDWGEYACPHTHTEEVAAVASTCTSHGHGAYTRCAKCKLPLFGSHDPLPLADHTYDDDFDADCNVCGETRNALLHGDANGDGKVNNHDLALLQRYLNEWESTIDLLAADMNGDGKITNRDLGLLQRLLNV